MMAGIGPANTKPEMLIRRALHALGYRYRLHVKGLPGKPDLVFPRRRAVIFVHGCFWHGHDCVLFRWPASRAEFWRSKITANIVRDFRSRRQLISTGWRVLEIWECTLRGKDRLPLDEVAGRCVQFLEGTEQSATVGSDQTIVEADC